MVYQIIFIKSDKYRNIKQVLKPQQLLYDHRQQQGVRRSREDEEEVINQEIQVGTHIKTQGSQGS